MVNAGFVELPVTSPYVSPSPARHVLWPSNEKVTSVSFLVRTAALTNITTSRSKFKSRSISVAHYPFGHLAASSSRSEHELLIVLPDKITQGALSYGSLVTFPPIETTYDSSLREYAFVVLRAKVSSALLVQLPSTLHAYELDVAVQF